jgi:hypothetical protein
VSDEAEDHGNEVEKAFIESENHEFDGIKLQPYSPARMIAAQSMKLFYGHVDDAGVADFQQTNVYPGAVNDIAVVLWLCSLSGKDSEDEIDRATRDPAWARRLAKKFAADHRAASTADDNFWAAYKILFRIMNEVDVSRAEAQKKMNQSAAEQTTKT